MQRTRALSLLLAGVACSCMQAAQPAGDPQAGGALAAGFRDPPESARPRTWWHWTGGNITLEGITKDLEWMKRAGIAGFQLADVSAGSGQVVEPRIAFGTPQWYAAVRHAAAEADRLGLEMALFSSPGWSETGGPWVTPAQGMKRMVFTEVHASGPARFDAVLPQAEANLGFYADSVVQAFALPPTEAAGAAARPRVTSSSGTIDAAALFDGNPRTGMTVKIPAVGQPAWVQLEFERAFDARAVTISGAGGGRNGIPVGRVLVGDSPGSLRVLVSLPGTQLYRQGNVRTFAFPATTGRVWRIEMTAAPLDPALTMSEAAPRVVDTYQLNEFSLQGGARVNRFEEKAGSNQFLFSYDAVPTPAVPREATLDPARIVNLSARMDADGRLRWDVPAGEWVIQRMGYVPTGARNRPATGPGSGLEADKLSGVHMEAYFHGYLDPIADALGPLFGKSLRYLVMDSWEAGMQNWTDDMIGEFHRRRGYDPLPYLPAMTGYVVGDADRSDRFLWDFRRTLADMWAEYHYGTMTRLLGERGMGLYSEAAGVSLEIPEDTLLNKKNVSIPMGEFWVRDLHPRLMYLQDVRGAASAAHVYGKPLVAAESFTGGAYESPFTLKKIGDYWLAQGINRMVFHTSAHQPLDTKPGNTMVGTHINRNITWAGQARPVMDYFSRQLYMLQQGRFVADLVYLLDEGAPSTPQIWGAGTTPAPPQGHDYDFINADALLELASVDAGGDIVLSTGMRYKLLVLPESKRMRPELLRKILAMVEQGATVTGPRPDASPSLAGGPQADLEVAQLAAGIWGDLDGISRTIRQVGKGHVFWGRTLDAVLDQRKVLKDFDYGGATADAEFAWLHRSAGDTDIYYLANLTDDTQHLDARFRIAGREAELWHPDSGKIAAASYRLQGERTLVTLTLAPREMVFVVFPRPASAPVRIVPEPGLTTVATLEGSWDLNFPAGLGAPTAIVLAQLGPWSAQANEGVRYFSGTATYRKSINVPRGWLRKDSRTLLDLGAVGDMAQVTLNGKPLGLLWKPPYRVDITDALQTGRNTLEIAVTNEWTNRIAGDRAVPAERRVLGGAAGASATAAARPNVPDLPAAGLLGPVSIVLQSTGTAP